MTSKMFYKVFNKYANMENQLRTERFKIISRRGINRVDSMNVKIPYRKAVYANCGLKQTFIQYKVSPSSQGKSTIKDRRELAIDSLLLFTDIGYRISISMADNNVVVFCFCSNLFYFYFCKWKSCCWMDYNNVIFILFFLWIIFTFNNSYKIYPIITKFTIHKTRLHN